MTDNTIKFRLTVNFLGCWFVSAGQEKGAYTDELILRDADGFPFVPGKTLKGVFREAFRVAGNSGWFDKFNSEGLDKAVFRDRLIQTIFGHDGKKEGFSQDELHAEGLIHFTNAALPATVKESIGEKKEYLFTTVQSTAIDNESGTALNQSLRTIEAAVPMHLLAEITLDPPFANTGESEDGLKLTAEDLSEISALFPAVSALITEIGGKRRRGFGRCMWDLGDSK
ncbi:MAG: RAMP superfamily CRISPR-associated protein [Succinimonas sp.]|nr:RAMP superfamily CRISPR-associated protein [Succinimonas sp.]